MRHNSRKPALAVLLAFVFLLAAVSGNPDEQEQTITGTVTATDWDDDDNVTEVAISVAIVIENEEEEAETIIEDYFVFGNEKGRELLKLVGYEVEATGRVTEDDEGAMTIHVTKYKVIEEEPNN